MRRYLSVLLGMSLLASVSGCVTTGRALATVAASVYDVQIREASWSLTRVAQPVGLVLLCHGPGLFWHGELAFGPYAGIF